MSFTIIPAAVIAVCSNIMSERETHATLDSLFMYAGAPGDPPEGISKHAKAQEWMRRVNKAESGEPLIVLGRLIEKYMEEEPRDRSCWEKSPSIQEPSDREKILTVLARSGFQYIRGGLIAGGLGAASKTLDDLIKEFDSPAIEQEFNRALENVDQSPREAVSAASNILESICKVYIAELGLEMPSKQDLKPVWNIVRKDLGFDSALVEDRDLQTIISGLLAVVDGIGALRTHASSAHGAGKVQYKLEPRHARLAVHAAHTVALFTLESWKKKR